MSVFALPQTRSAGAEEQREQGPKAAVLWVFPFLYDPFNGSKTNQRQHLSRVSLSCIRKSTNQETAMWLRYENGSNSREAIYSRAAYSTQTEELVSLTVEQVPTHSLEVEIAPLAAQSLKQIFESPRLFA
jgi:hypothetical protein